MSKLILFCAISIVFALPWEEYRVFDENTCSFPGGKISLNAFEMVPEIERIPRDLKYYNFKNTSAGITIDSGQNICRFNINLNCFELLNAADSLDSVAFMRRMYIKDTIPVKFYRGYTSAKAGFYKTALLFDETERPVRYTKNCFNGSGGRPVFHTEEITIYRDSSGKIRDSLSTLFSISGRGGSKTITTEYSIKRDANGNFATIAGVTLMIENQNSIDTRKNFTETYCYKYDSLSGGKTEVEYTRIDADSNLVVQRLRYIYIYALFTNRLLNESLYNTSDSLNPVLIRHTEHGYDDLNRPVKYSSIDSIEDRILECCYDNSERISKLITTTFENGSVSVYQIDNHYKGGTPLQTAGSSIIKGLLFCKYQNGTLSVSGAQSSSTVVGELYTAAGRKLSSKNQRSTSNGSATFDLTQTNSAAGIYIFRIINNGNSSWYRFKK